LFKFLNKLSNMSIHFNNIFHFIHIVCVRRVS
jgi:hypothetical protein